MKIYDIYKLIIHSVNIMEKLNTHFYDGKLQDSIKEIQNDLDKIKFISYEDKLKSLYILLNDLSTNKNIKPPGIRCLTTIVSDFSNKSAANYDHINKLSASELLYLCYEKIYNENKKDMIDILITQLNDMSSGMCPQGRTIRILQVLLTSI